MKKIEDFNVKFNNKVEKCEPSKELVMDEARINEDLKEQPSWYSWYATLQEKAESAYATAKLALEITEATVDAEIRLHVNEKLTEKKIANQILLNVKYQSARLTLIDAKEILGIVKAVKEGFQHRKDCLIALSSNMRIQADPTLFVNKQPKGSVFPSGADS